MGARITPPIGVDLTEPQALACAFRILARAGFSEHVAGHITWRRRRRQPVGEPLGAVVGRGDGLRRLRGRLRRQRDRRSLGCRRRSTSTRSCTSGHDARIVVHNHPYFVSLLAATGELPEIVHQTGTMFGDLRFVDEYTGEIDSPELGADLAERIGGATVIVLANHGVLITGETIAEATFSPACVDRMCRLAYDSMLLGKPTTPIAPGLARR